MAIELRIPSVGESVTEAFIGRWLKKPGDQVRKDEPVAELETDKANFELLAPAAGTLTRLLKKEGESAAIGEVVAYVEEGEGAAVSSPAPSPAEPAPAAVPRPPSVPDPPVVTPPPVSTTTPSPPPTYDVNPVHVAPLPVSEPSAPPGGVDLKPRVMPAARRVLEEYGLSAGEVRATGPGGRLLKEDVLRHIEQSRARAQGTGAAAAAVSGQGDGDDVEVVRMTPMRRTIARRLVEAQQTAAILTTFNEVDMHAVYDLRARYRDAFEKKHGVRLGFMSFFVKAAVDALKQFPSVNAEIRGDDIVYHKRYHVGVAVSTDRGLVVPVVRDADRLSFADLEKTIAELAKRARDKKLGLDDLLGGTFTVTNGGLFGSLMSTPILNPPQTGVLGMHGVQDRPVVRDGQIVIRPMMYIALSYDHRLIDGREAVTFLRRVKEAVEDPTRLLIDV